MTYMVGIYLIKLVLITDATAISLAKMDLKVTMLSDFAIYLGGGKDKLNFIVMISFMFNLKNRIHKVSY